MYTCAWLIGSVKSLPEQSVDIDGVAQILATGNYHLAHGTAPALLTSLIAMLTAAGVPAPTASITRDRRVKLTAGAVFAIDWGLAGETLRDLLGFDADLAGSLVYIAPLVSPLHWSPTKPLRSEMAPRGARGIRRPLAYYSMSPTDGSAFVVSHGERVDQSFSCSHVPTDRIQTPEELGGEWAAFFLAVVARGYLFTVYLDVVENPGSTTTADLDNPLGPYVATPAGRAASWSYARSKGFEWTDRRADWSISCRVAPEYT